MLYEVYSFKHLHLHPWKQFYRQQPCNSRTAIANWLAWILRRILALCTQCACNLDFSCVVGRRPTQISIYLFIEHQGLIACCPFAAALFIKVILWRFFIKYHNFAFWQKKNGDKKFSWKNHSCIQWFWDKMNKCWCLSFKCTIGTMEIHHLFMKYLLLLFITNEIYRFNQNKPSGE